MAIISFVLPPTHEDRDDVLVFKPSTSWAFSVKKAYNAITSPSQQQQLEEKELSQAIWKKGYVQPRLRLFLWKCSKNVLPLSEILFGRSSKGDPCCALCGQEESMQHMLFNCPFARACWFMGSVVLRSDAIQGTISQILRHLAQTLDEVEWTTCVNMMWAIWRCRNDKSYSSKTPTPVMFRQHLSTSVGNVTGKLC